ncbi:pyridoxal phosphate-dependent aminotransferase [Halobaculum sp. MBLA0143]|uniref:pyridoxal phosphate-dependent aminotransferase n=1 Tax=Halobaculum sp. MBLA0143 TaxID=3079933 RepID=UPI003524EA10
MHELAGRVDDFERSQIRVMFDLAGEAEAAGEDPVRLEVGEPDFDTPEHVTEAAFEAVRDGATDYTASAGIDPLRRAIADTLAADYDLPYDPDQVVATVGGMEALHVTMLTLVDPGETVVTPSPVWPNYEIHAALAGGDLREVPLSYPYDLDADRVIDAVDDDTAAVVLTTPSNPTGRVYDPEPVARVTEAAAEHDAYVIADEVYAGLTYDRDPTGVAAVVDHPERVVTVGSLSKTHAMTGWRLGWLAAPDAVVDGATKVREGTTSCPPAPSQHAALAALTGPAAPAEEMYAAFRERRDYVARRLDEIDGVRAPRPEGAFYAFLDVEGATDSLALAKRLLSEHGVVLAPGSGFGEGDEGRLRLSFANSRERLETGLDRLADAV